MREQDYVYTNSGKRIDITHFKGWDADLRDILFGINSIFRYNGQSSITVLRHSVGVASFFRGRETAFRYALLHDAAEAYMMDVPTAHKRFLTPAWSLTYDNIESAILNKFKAVPTEPERQEVHNIDKAVVAYEMDCRLGLNGFPRTLEIDPRVKDYSDMDARYLWRVQDDVLPYIVANYLGENI